MSFLFYLPFLLFLVFSTAHADKYFFKNLQGPPDEFSSFSDNTYKNFTPITTSAATISFTLDQGVFITEFLVDSYKGFGFCTISPVANDLEYSFIIPDHPSSLSISDLMELMEGAQFDSTFALGLANSYSSICYEFSSPQVGSWNVTVSSQGDPRMDTGMFLLWNDSPYQLKSSADYHIAVGDDVDLGTQIHDFVQDRLLVNTNPETTFSSHAVIIHPSGTQSTISLTDSDVMGIKDGVFNGQFQVREKGVYQVTTVFEGSTPEGLRFRRTADQVMRAIHSKIRLSDGATAKTNGDYLEITMTIDRLEHESDELIAYAEVWGTKSEEDVPVAWISGIIKGTSSNGAKKDQFTLLLHLAWIEKANAVAPFSLRQIRIQDKGSSVTLAQQDQMSITLPQNHLRSMPHLRHVQFTEEMFDGPRPEHLLLNNRRSDAPGKKILVHGYCSDALAWPESDFTDFIIFRDPNANRKIDEFARLVLSFANDSGVDRFSIIAHSQGGLVGLHIATYYWSGLDLARNGNILTSVGSPYHGTVMAGTLASIGWVFGMGCGANDDLTPDGAEAWLSSIPLAKRSLVHYYTTNSNDPFCSTGSNWVGLESPNDGVVAVSYGQLANATSMGNYDGWCHTSTMNSPFQCSDKERNAEINRNAAL